MKKNIKIILLIIAASIIGMAATVTRHETGKKLTFKNVLILGNSITRHQPAPQLGWYGDWGMAASSRDKDFVHILEKNFLKIYQPAVVHFQNISIFERSYWKYDLSKFDSLRSLHPDLIILRIGENVSSNSLEKYNFETYYQSLIDYFINNNRKVKILCVSSFWRKDQVDTLIEKASNRKNCYYLKISQLSKDSTNMAISQFENKGVAMHPSDKGMAAIASLIWEKISLIR